MAYQVGAPEDSERSNSADAGRAIIELVVLAVVILIPLIYILISMLRLQATTYAVSQAARDAARLMDNAPSVSAGYDRAMAAAAVALNDQNVPAEGLTVRFVKTGADCRSAAEQVPDLNPGSIFDICVIAQIVLPGVPGFLTGTDNTVTGVFTLHVGDFREPR